MKMTESQKQKIVPVVNAYRSLNTEEKALFTQALEFFDTFMTPSVGPARRGRKPKATTTTATTTTTTTAALKADEFKCDECDRAFDSQHGRAIHMGREHAKKH